MRHKLIKRIAVLGLVVAGLACPSVSWAELTIHSGWDLFITDSGVTTFNYAPFQGVPLGTFDFDDSIGVKDVGDVDTIMYRPTNIVGPDGGGSVHFTADLVAWQLRSVNELNWGAGMGYYYLTLHSGSASTDSGTMTFNSGGTNGTFTDTLDVFYDVRFGGLTGDNIVMSGECKLLNDGASWTRDQSYFPVITGVNYLLNGSDTTEDFWPGRIRHYGEGADAGNIHVVPEPGVGTLILLAGGLLGLTRFHRRTR